MRKDAFRDKTILVVDDDQTMRLVLQAILTRHGATVLLAEDGMDAKEHLANNPHAIILDLRMPRMNGFEFADYLRQRRPDLLRHTMIFTAMPSSIDALFGNVPVLHKPFDLERFLPLVENRLGDGPPVKLGNEWRTYLQSHRTTDKNRRQITPAQRVARRKSGEGVSSDQEHMARMGSIGGRRTAKRRKRK